MNKKPNYTKQEMHTQTTGKLNRAMKGADFTMRPLYLIEDRLNRLLYALGIINVYEKGSKATSKARLPLREMLELKEKAQLGVNKMHTKLKTPENCRGIPAKTNTSNTLQIA